MLEKETLAYDQSNLVTLPEGLGCHVLTLDRLIAKVGDDLERMEGPRYVGQRAIWCTTNLQVDSINELMIDRWRGVA